ncbi:MAG: polyphenol oxidase family protein, partial [Bacteroidetes bacterium]|nr:polyphenol oxidase family protein [Bacteroidota bacterium]
DPLRNVVAAIHAGWRGAALGIVRKTIQIMQKRFCTNPALLRCFIGPSAGVCCYEVGFDVAAHFKENVLSSRNRKLYLNLKEEVQQQLIHEGVERVNIEIHQGCTICTPQQFFSYRRDGSQTGRMIAFIGIVEE